MKPSSDYPFLYVRSMCNSGGSIPLTYLTVTVLYQPCRSIHAVTIVGLVLYRYLLPRGIESGKNNILKQL